MFNYRKLIVGADTPIKIANGQYVKYVNFDNAATTPPFISVVEDLLSFLPYYSSIHRGMGMKSQISTKAYDDARESVANFVGIDARKASIIFVKNTTEAINKLSNMLYDKYKGGIVISTTMEHHSNDLPWRKFNIKYVDVDKYGRLSIEDLKYKLKKYRGKVVLVTVTGASNVTGYKNSIYDIARIVHQYGSKLLVDGAQFVPHSPIYMGDECSDSHIDYLAFSAHKMYAPFGIGVLIGSKDEFNSCNPDYCGGGTVDVVTHDFVKWASTPDKDEAGSPNVIGAVALVSAINTLQKLDMNLIEEYEKSILHYAYNSLKSIPEVKLYCDNCNNCVGIVPFNINGIYHETLSKILSYEFGIAVRSGCFCAQPYIQKLLNVPIEKTIKMMEEHGRRPGMVRLSFSLYNTFDEIDYLVYALRKIINYKNKYLAKYD